MITPCKTGGGKTPSLGRMVFYENGASAYSSNTFTLKEIKGRVLFQVGSTSSSGNRYWRITKNGSTVGTIYANSSPKELSVNVVRTDTLVATKYEAGNSVPLTAIVYPEI